MERQTSRDVQAGRFELHHVDDNTLMQRLAQLVRDGRALEADLLAHIAEVDERRLYARRAAPSMFQYCVTDLHLSESAAFKRIRAARAARRFPVLFEKVETGDLHVTAISLLAPHLTPDNHGDLIAAATHQSKRDIERIIAERFPRPDVQASVRKLPAQSERKGAEAVLGSARAAAGSNAAVIAAPAACGAPTPPPAGSASSDVRASGDSNRSGELPRAAQASLQASVCSTAARTRVEPLSPQRYRVQFTADADFCAKLQEAVELLGHRVDPNDLATIFERSLDSLIAELKLKKHGVKARRDRSPVRVDAPGATVASSVPATTRYIPRQVRREVFDRDQGQCAYRDADGRRCPERRGVEYHHRKPHALGGPPTAQNVELRCRAHNLLAAEEDFGASLVGRFRRNRRGTTRTARAPSRAPAAHESPRHTTRSGISAFDDGGGGGA